MNQAIRPSHRRLILKLIVVVLGACAFGYALVPLYDVLCRVTGLNGKTEGAVSQESVDRIKADRSRWVTVEFGGTTMQGLSWEFRPMQERLEVHPGEITTTSFYVRNPTNQDLVGQAVPSVSPGWAAQYFKKLDCFCFKQQPLKAGEEKQMPLVFYVSPDLPTDVREIALTYSFFPITNTR
ncbi:cytochrome c oxidase assembly protein subunit 11 [Gammaproteobacteria bacterium]